MSLFSVLIGTLAFAVLAPVLGCLLAGLDRKISARMQGRVGPPLLQPYYDVRKLLEKDNVSVNSTEGTYVTCALVFTLIAGGADADAGAVSFRLRDGEQVNGVPVDEALDHIAAVIAGRVNDPAGERPARD